MRNDGGLYLVRSNGDGRKELSNTQGLQLGDPGGAGAAGTTHRKAGLSSRRGPEVLRENKDLESIPEK